MSSEDRAALVRFVAAGVALLVVVANFQPVPVDLLVAEVRVPLMVVVAPAAAAGALVALRLRVVRHSRHRSPTRTGRSSIHP